MARPSSFTSMQKEKKAQLQAQFEQKRKQLTVSKDNKYKKAMLESVLKEYAKHLYTHLENNSKEKIMEQVSVVINRVTDAYPRILSASDWNDVYGKINELNFWNEDLVRDKIKFNFLKRKVVMDNDANISMPDTNTSDTADIKADEDLSDVNVNDTGAQNKKVKEPEVKDPMTKTIEDLNDAAVDGLTGGSESLNTFINKRLNDNTRMYVEGYYNLIVSAMKSANSADPWFMTL